jgi:tetratricopeptide (TPR) repeat protein
VTVPALLAALVVLVLAAGPVRAVVPDPGTGAPPLPAPPAASTSLTAVIDALKRGDKEAALKGAREFTKAQPGNATGQELLGVAAQVNRLYREAETAYTEALRLEPGRLPVVVRLGQLALETRDPKKAEGWFRKALAANADLGAARRGLVVALLRQRQIGSALNEAREATRRDPKDLDAKILLAQIYLDMGRATAAEAVLDEALAAAPDSAQALQAQGLVKLDLGKADEAEKIFEKVVQQDPKSLSARMGLAIVERARGRLDEAAAEMEAIAKERPDLPVTHFELGRTRLMQRQIEPAMRAFDRAEQTSPDPAVTRARAAGLLAAAGERDRAIAKAQASLASTNAAPLARAVLARLYLEKGQPDLAERELQAAAKDAPQSVPARLQLARFYLAQRRPADAVAAAQEAEKLAPRTPEPLAVQIDAYIAQGKADDAVATAARLRALQGNTAFAYTLYGVVNEKAGRPADALAAYQTALDKEPHQLAAARARANLLERQSRGPEARELLETTAQGRPQSIEPLLDLARLEERAGNPSGAVAAYRRALARAPENTGILNNLAYLLAGDPATSAEAVTLAEKAHAAAPNSAAVADTLGWALYQKGDLARAEELLTRVAKAAPASGEVRYHLGMVYAKQGKAEDARRELEAAIKAGNFKGIEDAQRALESLK